MLTLRVPRPALQRRRGLSLVELMIGIAIGMFVLAGATMVVSNQLADNRRLLLETQVQQDMRATMDIISREIRRSGYWAAAYKTVGPADGTAPPTLVNPYGSVGMASNPPTEMTYSGSRDLYATAARSLLGENGVVDADENNGVRFNSGNGTIEVMLSSGNWQALTDNKVLKITAFSAVPVVVSLNLPVCAAPPCPGATGCGNRRVSQRYVDVVLNGEAVSDTRVKRVLQNTVRVRNDEVCQ